MFTIRLICAKKQQRVLHICRREPRHHLSFEDFFLPFSGQLSGDNRWIKLAELIPWDDLEDNYASQFCKGFVALAKLFRMALGALIIKARLSWNLHLSQRGIFRIKQFVHSSGRSTQTKI